MCCFGSVVVTGRVGGNNGFYYDTAFSYFAHGDGEGAFSLGAFDVRGRTVQKLADTFGHEHGCDVPISHLFDSGVE